MEVLSEVQTLNNETVSAHDLNDLRFYYVDASLTLNKVL